MQQRSGSTLRGVLTISLMTVNVIAWCTVLFVVALLKLVVPFQAWRRPASRAMTALAEGWIGTNKAIFRLMGSLPLDVRGLDGLSTRDWYLVVSNHQTWVDILVLQAVSNRRIPFLKFFLKQELIWVPFLGLAWWALDFPFMRRHSPAYLARHPEKRGEDLEVTRRACEKFRQIPTSVMNFVEGTRYTERKRAAFKSPYRHLLPPRRGGTAFVLSAMGGMLHAMLDVTIAYRGPAPSLWDLCCGSVGTVTVDIRKRPIDDWMSTGDFAGDLAFRNRFKDWLNGIWAEKDQLLERLLARGQ